MRLEYKIKGLKLDKDILGNYSISSSNSDMLLPLGKLNIFVGTNNSGKSRLVRGLLMIEKLSYLPTDFDFANIQKSAREIKQKVQSILNHAEFGDIVPNGGSSLIQSIAQINPHFSFGDEPNLISSLVQLFHNIKRLKENNWGSRSGRPSPASFPVKDDRQITAELYQLIFGEYAQFQEQLSKTPSTPTQFDKLYIPIMRGMRPAIEQGGDIYGRRTVNDYFTNDDKSVKYPNINVFTGLNIYQEIQTKLLGTLQDRNLVREYERYLSDKFFEGKPVALIPRKGHDVLTIKIGNEKEKEIYNVGDGLQTLITITYPLFEHAKLNKNKPLLVCIEEPELLVHPGLQRTLMNELVCSPLYKDAQFFVTTHSNHFLDLTLDYDDVSIFRVVKQLNDKTDEETPTFEIENVSNKDKQTLDLLGVRNSSVFLSNATIWVEGITDRMYLRHAYSLWQKEKKKDPSLIFKEDAHFAFIEYSGSNLSHWDFVDKGPDQMAVHSVVSKIFLIADNDKDVMTRKTTQKDARLNAIKKTLKANFYRLKMREIENLISPGVLKKVMAEKANLDPDKIILLQTDYANERMGRFLKDKFKLKSFADKYGAITNKKAFAERVLENTKSLKDLSPEMISICKKIDKFISTSNLR